MILDRSSLRLNMTVVVSLGVHVSLLALFGSKPFQEAPRKLTLTEVEFQEEKVKPTAMEKLMTKIAAPPKPAPPPAAPISESEAIAELQKETFSKVVGLKEGRKADEMLEADLTKLAALPKLESLKQPLAPALQQTPPKRIALARAQTSGMEALESKVVPLDELPPADFGPEISKRSFQQPEMIIRQVKAERRQQTGDSAPRQLNLQRGALITGEVRNREILQQESPAVPRWLEEKGIAAEVVIHFVVNPDGEVGDKMFVEKTSGYAELDRLAMDALKKFLFAPLPLTVRQAEQTGTITIRFALKSGR